MAEQIPLDKNFTLFYDLEMFKENTFMSPHTIRLINNPIHAYLCSGDDCREEINNK